MLLLQARQLLPQRAFVLVGHWHRCSAGRMRNGSGAGNFSITFSTPASKVCKNHAAPRLSGSTAAITVNPFALARAGILRYTLTVREIH